MPSAETLFIERMCGAWASAGAGRAKRPARATRKTARVRRARAGRRDRLDPAPRWARRRAQAVGLNLGNSQRSARLGSARLGSARLGSARLGSARLGSARLGSARLGSARLGSARLGSARLGSARLGSALIMRANGPGRFCQVFLRVIHNFSPSVPFRADDRAPPHTSRGKAGGAGVDGCKRCHGSLLRHAARAIVMSRPLHEAHDRQLRQTVPAVVRDRQHITLTSAPLSHYPIGRIRKEKDGERPRTRPPRGRYRAAVYSNSVSDSTSRTRSTCPEIGCLR